MASVIFNSFKQRYLNGEVPRSDTWNFIPVNKDGYDIISVSMFILCS